MQTTGKVLVVDDEPSVRKVIREFLTGAGFEVQAVGTGKRAIGLSRSQSFDVAIVDIGLRDMSGLQVTKRLKDFVPDTEIIVITGKATVETAVQALREDVFDYLQKPLEMGPLIRVVGRAIERRRLLLDTRRTMLELQAECADLRRRLERRGRPSTPAAPRAGAALIGKSKAISRVKEFVQEVAPSSLTVLLRGESGTGKDIVARMIHRASGRTGPGDFIKINCPAIPETLLESELFGHEAGAFTGADRRKPGRFELAAGGTIFLDEIGEIPLAVQVKLLQAIEHKEFTRLGGSRTIATKARIIAATNAPLEQMIADGRFRSDLFYRLNQYSIVLPPLSTRKEDIPLLIDHFLVIYGRRSGKSGLELSPAMRAKLVEYAWPGNVRELESVIQRFALSGKESSIELGAVPPVVQVSVSKPVRTGPKRAAPLRDSEIEAIVAALTESRWNQRKAAEALGISYSSLRRRVAKYDLKRRWGRE